MPRRRMPPVVSDADRIEAARIASDQLCAEMRSSELLRATWTDAPPLYDHFIASDGRIISERR